MNKKKNSTILLFAVCSGLLLSGCSSTQTSNAYGLDTYSNYGLCDFVYHERLVLSKGNVIEMTLDETYSPAMWARVNPDEIQGATIETISVNDVKLPEGGTGTVTYAKHIKIGNYTLTGTLRDPDAEDTYYARGEPVAYNFDSSAFKVKDLVAFLDNGADVSTYRLGTNSDWYYNAVMDGEIYCLGTTAAAGGSSSSAGDSSSAITSTSGSEEISSAPSATYDAMYTPYFPSGEKLFTAIPGNAILKAAFKTLCDFFVGLKQFDYVTSESDSDKNKHLSLKIDSGTGHYFFNTGYAHKIFSDDNWVDTGVSTTDITFMTMDLLFTSASYAYAYQEYNSKK